MSPVTTHTRTHFEAHQTFKSDDVWKSSGRNWRCKMSHGIQVAVSPLSLHTNNLDSMETRDTNRR